ncbi:MAG TPA: hypothetical protein VGN15_05955 [Ktedonobacteraceae bacterium]|nr:hypothetical protein [Ktedonobacteraceae bacterium]
MNGVQSYGYGNQQPARCLDTTATKDDLEAVASLLNTYYMSDYEWSFSEQSLRSAWQSPHFQLEKDTWIAFTADGQILLGQVFSAEFDLSSIRAV